MILIVGGTGFIGKNLAHTLHLQGRAARIASRSPDVKFLNRHAPTASSISMPEFVADPAAALAGCQAVIYLVSTSTPAANLNAPWREIKDNIELAMQTMMHVATHSQAHFIFISSGGAIYGRTTEDPIKEETPLNPISPYGLGKKMTEAGLDYMAATQGLRHTILRPGNPIGLWQRNRSQGIIGILMNAVLTNSPFTIFGNGQAARDYFDVADLVDAILATIDAPDISIGKIWNVGSGTSSSVNDMLKMVQNITNRQIETRFEPPRASDVDRIALDISRISSALGWQPRIALEDCLERIWRETLKAA